ncbi:MAG: YCII-related domain superfamily [Thermoleophilia bacterium]|nr:YCII-related domain superfamily [Thermoleophilia bacterium]
MPFFARILRFAPGDPHRLAVRPIHREYVAALFARGELRWSGPFADDDGALLVYETESREAAEALIADDPYTLEAVSVEAELKEWNIVTPLH